MANQNILNLLATGGGPSTPGFSAAAVRGEQIRASQQQRQQNALNQPREQQQFEQRNVLFDQSQQERLRLIEEREEAEMGKDIVGAYAPLFMPNMDETRAAGAYQQATQSLKQKYGDSIQAPDQYPGMEPLLTNIAPFMQKQFPGLLEKVYEQSMAPKPVNYGAPVAGVGPDGKPMFNRFPETGAGAPITVPNFQPPPKEPTQRSVQFEDIAQTDGTFQKSQVNQDGTTKPVGAPFRKSADASVELRRDLAQDKKDATFNKLEEGSLYSMDLLDKLVQHPGLSAVVGVPGMTGGLMFGYTVPGTDAAGFKALHEQIGGRQFLEAYNTLKGGGAITEIEGIKATNAIARLQTPQKEEDFIAAANEFKGVIERGLIKARQMRQAVGQQQSPQGGNLRTATNPQTGEKITESFPGEWGP